MKAVRGHHSLLARPQNLSTARRFPTCRLRIGTFYLWVTEEKRALVQNSGVWLHVCGNGIRQTSSLITFGHSVGTC